MKYYESLRVVFEIQAQLKEWSEDQPGAAVAEDDPGAVADPGTATQSEPSQAGSGGVK
jgi:hypothetical protein